MARFESWLSVGLLAAAVVVACKKDHEKPASGHDKNGEGGDESGSSSSRAPIGELCEGRPDACQDGECRSYADYQPAKERQVGFCSRVCEAESDCPSGFRCTQTSADRLCLPRCSDHSECGYFSAGWKCAEAQGERICANPQARGGEIVLRTQLVIDNISFGTAEQAWRFVPGVWAEVSVRLVNKGSSGPVTGTAVISSASEWVEVGETVFNGGTRVRTLEGVPLGEPQQLTVTVPDPLGTGSVEVPFFIRSLTSGLHLEPTIGVPNGAGAVDIQGRITGFGTAPSLTNEHNGASAPWAVGGDPWLADQPVFGSMGSIDAANARPGDVLGLSITEPTGSSWEGLLRVVPYLEGLVFLPKPVRRSEVAGGKVAMTYFWVRDTTVLDQNGPLTMLTLSSDQPWAHLLETTVGTWTGSVNVGIQVTEPPDPTSSRAWISVSWSGTEIARMPVEVLPDL